MIQKPLSYPKNPFKYKTGKKTGKEDRIEKAIEILGTSLVGFLPGEDGNQENSAKYLVLYRMLKTIGANGR